MHSFCLYNVDERETTLAHTETVSKWFAQHDCVFICKASHDFKCILGCRQAHMDTGAATITMGPWAGCQCWCWEAAPPHSPCPLAPPPGCAAVPLPPSVVPPAPHPTHCSRLCTPYPVITSSHKILSGCCMSHGSDSTPQSLSSAHSDRQCTNPTECTTECAVCR